MATTVKGLLKEQYAFTKTLITEVHQYKKTDKPFYYAQLVELLGAFASSNISGYSKPNQKLIYYAIRNLPVKHFLTVESLAPLYTLRSKIGYNKKKKSTYKKYRKFFRGRRSYRKRSYIRRKSGYSGRRYSRRSYRSYGRRRSYRRY